MFRRLFYFVAAMGVPLLAFAGESGSAVPAAISAAVAQRPLAEILRCYLPYLWLKKGASAWLLMPAALSLALFAWVLTLHPAAAGRIYAD